MKQFVHVFRCERTGAWMLCHPKQGNVYTQHDYLCCRVMYHVRQGYQQQLHRIYYLTITKNKTNGYKIFKSYFLCSFKKKTFRVSWSFLPIDNSTHISIAIFKQVHVIQLPGTLSKKHSAWQKYPISISWLCEVQNAFVF